MASIVTHKMDYTFLEQLNDQRDNWSIRVRIVRMCIVYTTQSENEPISLDIILLDEKKTPLHATIKKELLPTFKNMIQEDIIGTLHVVGHEEQVYVGDKPTKILRLEIKMHGGETIKVTLWRNIVADFQNLFVHHKLHDGPKVVAITSTTVKKFRDDYSINSTSTTRVYINLDIPEFNILSQSDSSQSQEDEVREIPPQDFSHNTPEKRMVRNQTTLKHIMAMKWESNVQERVFTICATVNDIDYKFGWNYIGCENCLTKLTQQGQQYNCPSCDMTSKYPAPRCKTHNFKVHFMYFCVFWILVWRLFSQC
uniref:Uncharacterized protein LOC105852911 isoform X2 n=1 Tax=Cicer arietinum TaxID=3827 RepID=A0A3Q7YB26_CICAR|nr:uncharacterized protein LOC105852911 isoform X2 [Cicer arietinum]